MVNQEDNILVLDHLTVDYAGNPPKRAVNDVSFSVVRGQCVGVVGGSGCGKTTIAKTLICLEQPTAGRILFDGVDIATLNADGRRKYRHDVQMVFQDTLGALNPRLRIGTALREVLSVHRQNEFRDEREMDACVCELLDKVELPSELKTRFPHEVSGGQRQRVGIARALAVNPRLLIADEPVSALDVAVQAQMLKMLRKLLDSTGLTMLFIAHDLAVVRCLCDYTVVMNAGKVVEAGDPRTLFSSPQSGFTKALVDAVPDVSRALQSRWG